MRGRISEKWGQEFTHLKPGPVKSDADFRFVDPQDDSRFRNGAVLDIPQDKNLTTSRTEFLKCPMHRFPNLLLLEGLGWNITPVRKVECAVALFIFSAIMLRLDRHLAFSPPHPR